MASVKLVVGEPSPNDGKAIVYSSEHPNAAKIQFQYPVAERQAFFAELAAVLKNPYIEKISRAR
ncbi:hypothetical protein HC928_23485 [bacterium]|nr:hypothetical protein [bacterium]